MQSNQRRSLSLYSSRGVNPLLSSSHLPLPRPRVPLNVRLWAWMVSHFNDYDVRWENGGLKYPEADIIFWYTHSTRFTDKDQHKAEGIMEGELNSIMKHYAIVATTIYNNLVDAQGENDSTLLTGLIVNVSTILHSSPSEVSEYFSHRWLEADSWKRAQVGLN